MLPSSFIFHQSGDVSIANAALWIAQLLDDMRVSTLKRNVQLSLDPPPRFLMGLDGA